MSEDISVNPEIVGASIKKMDGMVEGLTDGIARLQAIEPQGSPPATVALFQAELRRMINVSRRALEDTQVQIAGLAQQTYAAAADLQKLEDETKASLMNIERAALDVETSRTVGTPGGSPMPTTSPRVDQPAAVPGTSTGIR